MGQTHIPSKSKLCWFATYEQQEAHWHSRWLLGSSEKQKLGFKEKFSLRVLGTVCGIISPAWVVTVVCEEMTWAYEFKLV